MSGMQNPLKGWNPPSLSEILGTKKKEESEVTEEITEEETDDSTSDGE